MSRLNGNSSLENQIFRSKFSGTKVENPTTILIIYLVQFINCVQFIAKVLILKIMISCNTSLVRNRLSA